MSELQLTFDDRGYSFAPGTAVRIGRSSESHVVVDDPTVSRQHAQISWQAGSWVWQNTGQAATFLNGQPVARFGVGGLVKVTLASPAGPVIELQATAPREPVLFRPNVAARPGAPAGQAADPVAPVHAAAPQVDRGSFFETLIPVRSWLHDRGWRQGIRLLIIPYALLPLVYLGLFTNSHTLATPGWAYSLYVAPLWLLAFWYLIRPPRLGKLEVYLAVGITAWTAVWIKTVTIFVNNQLGTSLNLPKALLVGYNEEISKALPVLVAAMALLKFRGRKLDPRAWMLMGTIAGLTFGLVEQSLYAPSAIVAIQSSPKISQVDYGALLFAFRVFVDGFQHAVWAGVSGFFVGMAVNYRRRRIPLLLLGVSIPAVLHALNDWSLTIFSTVWAAVLVQAFSLLLFLGYTLSAAAIERAVRANPAFRGQSMLMERFSQPEEAV